MASKKQELHEQVGRLKIEIEWLKKTARLSRKTEAIERTKTSQSIDRVSKGWQGSCQWMAWRQFANPRRIWLV